MTSDKCKTCGNRKYKKCTLLYETQENCPFWTDNPNQIDEADWMTEHYKGWLFIQKYLRKIKKFSRRGEKSLTNIITETDGDVNC